MPSNLELWDILECNDLCLNYCGASAPCNNVSTAGGQVKVYTSETNLNSVIKGTPLI